MNLFVKVRIAIILNRLYSEVVQVQGFKKVINKP